MDLNRLEVIGRKLYFNIFRNIQHCKPGFGWHYPPEGNRPEGSNYVKNAYECVSS